MRHAVDRQSRVVFERIPTRIRNWLLMLGLLLISTHARAYRPFSSTDADVADPEELETELGYFTLEHSAGEDIFIVPRLVLNSGLLGFIWESRSSGDSFDGGIRWGISSVALDWQFTLGWTFSFPRR